LVLKFDKMLLNYKFKKIGQGHRPEAPAKGSSQRLVSLWPRSASGRDSPLD